MAIEELIYSWCGHTGPVITLADLDDHVPTNEGLIAAVDNVTNSALAARTARIIIAGLCYQIGGYEEFDVVVLPYPNGTVRGGSEGLPRSLS